MGARLAKAARRRNEPSSGLVRLTLVAGVPAIILVAYIAYAFVVALVRL
jgi:hypothetical protein